MNSKTVQTILAICIIVGMAIGAVSYFATASEVKLVEMRLDQKILADQINQIRQMMWQLEDRYGSDLSTWYDQDAKDRYRQLSAQLAILITKYKLMIGRVTK